MVQTAGQVARKVLRGGTFINNQNRAAASYRNNNNPNNRNNNNGFRVVVGSAHILLPLLLVIGPGPGHGWPRHHARCGSKSGVRLRQA